MHIEGDFRVKAPAARVYAFFLDPVAFTNCLDDPHEFHAVDADHFEGTITTGVAFIRGTFRVRGAYTGRTPNSEVKVHLQGAGMGSGIDGDLVLSIAEAAGETTLHWQGEIRPSGPVATIGERMVKGTIDKKAAGLFENARKTLEGGA
ncbi:MAG TPA: carbon monoxide dehydrogenase subunit G [Thermoplasmata archaeon]|nr:carbon monoxide dehydrogenase subunit G [Thermoplasmata archaeon]